jgi:hypothetical protein
MPGAYPADPSANQRRLAAMADGRMSTDGGMIARYFDHGHR